MLNIHGHCETLCGTVGHWSTVGHCGALVPASRMKTVNVISTRLKRLWRSNTGVLYFNSMGQKLPWELHSRSASQEISRLLRNPKVHYRVHKISLWDPILSQMNSVHTITFYYLRSSLILFLNLRLGFPVIYFLQVSRLKHCVYFTYFMRAACPTHLILFDLIMEFYI
jgi:hypothetical protein